MSPWRIHVCMPWSWIYIHIYIYMDPHLPSTKTPVMLASIYHTYGSYGHEIRILFGQQKRAFFQVFFPGCFFLAFFWATSDRRHGGSMWRDTPEAEQISLSCRWDELLHHGIRSRPVGTSRLYFKVVVVSINGGTIAGWFIIMFYFMENPINGWTGGSHISGTHRMYPCMFHY